MEWPGQQADLSPLKICVKIFFKQTLSQAKGDGIVECCRGTEYLFWFHLHGNRSEKQVLSDS